MLLIDFAPTTRPSSAVGSGGTLFFLDSQYSNLQCVYLLPDLVEAREHGRCTTLTCKFPQSYSLPSRKSEIGMHSGESSRDAAAFASLHGPIMKVKDHYPRLVGKTTKGRNSLRNCVWCAFRRQAVESRASTKKKRTRSTFMC